MSELVRMKRFSKATTPSQTSAPRQESSLSRQVSSKVTLGKMDCHALSDVGQSRRSNEDQFMVADLVRTANVKSTSLCHDKDVPISGRTHAKLMLVADGMGGHAAGHRASMLAADNALQYILDHFPWVSEDRSESNGAPSVARTKLSFVKDRLGPKQQLAVAGLDDCIRHSQKAVLDDAAWNPNRRGMGTTLTMALLEWPSVYVAHVGDSRCYVCRDGKLLRLTTDHTYAQAMVDAGEMTSEEATRSRFSHALWNVVGGHDATIEPCVEVHQLEIGDTLVLCTDGLTNQVDDKTIEQHLIESADAQQACERLVKLANDNGGKDNITLIVAKFVDAKTYEESAREESNSHEIEFTLSDSTLQVSKDVDR